MGVAEAPRAADWHWLVPDRAADERSVCRIGAPPFGMAGGYYSKRQLDRDQSIAQRGGTGGSTDSPDSRGVKPCWLVPTPQRRAGHVIAWLPVNGGGWRAVVVVTVDASDLQSRLTE